MSRSLWLRLAGLMFLQYFVMGLWAVTLAAFLMGSPHEGGLNLSARRVGLIYGTFALAATISPLFVGLLADRLFATQRVLAVLHLLGIGLLGAMLLTSEHFREETKRTFFGAISNERVEHRPLIRDGRDRTIRLSETSRPARLDILLWEEIALQQYLGQESPRPKYFRIPQSFPELEDVEHPLHELLVHLGIVQRSIIRSRGSAILSWEWMSEDCPVDRYQYLTQFRAEIQPALQRVRTHPEVTAASERAFAPLFALMLAYACVFLPTLTLSNALTFRNLPDPARHYAPIRALGTVGWIAAGLFIGFAAPAVSALPFLYAAITSAALAALCLLLPHTPPASQPKTLGDALGLPALRLLADRSFLVFVFIALLSTALMPFYNSFANKFLVDLHVEHPAAVQTLAQPTEIVGALLLPWLWARFGAKRMLLFGLLASAARFAAFASQSVTGVLAVGLPLHGVGFSLFYIAAALYVDKLAPRDLRASAQGLVTLVTFGAGGIAGNWFAGRVVEWHTAGGVVDWGPVWLVPALGTLTAAVLFGVLFREPGAGGET